MSETHINSVPCNGCIRCCKGDAVRLLPGDNPDEYLTEPHQTMPGQLMLAHKPNGDCIYLAENGCSIHERKPTMCRTMDCRNIAKALTYTQARKLIADGRLQAGIWRKGRELLCRQ